MKILAEIIELTVLLPICGFLWLVLFIKDKTVDGLDLGIRGLNWLSDYCA